MAATGWAQEPIHGAIDCILPEGLCSRLRPDMVVFIAKPISVVKNEYGEATVTFDIQERLWGLTNERLVTVYFGEGYSDKGRQFISASRNSRGTFWSHSCDGGLALPLDHPWVAEFRRNLAERRPAQVPVLLRSYPGYVTIGGADIQLHGNGLEFKDRNHAGSMVEFKNVPPGSYSFAAIKKNFTQMDSKEPISILPGSCADLRAYIKPTSGVSGRVVDARGAPVGDTELMLEGTADPKVRDESIVDTVLGSIHASFYRLTGWGKDPARWLRSAGSFKTDSNGWFTANVLPGRYYLLVLPSRIGGYADIPLPAAYYPGVYGWEHATPLIVEEGKILENVLYWLPDLGGRRRVEIRVVSEDGVPVRGVTLREGGRDGIGKMTSSGFPKTTGADGRAVYSLWSGCDYNFSVEYYPHPRSYTTRFELPAGASPVRRTVTLPGLHL
jgi:hypothetical protein